jgi:hypothetical protein
VQPRGHYDAVHSHYWLSGQVGALARDRWGVPLVHTMHTMARVKNESLAAGLWDASRPELCAPYVDAYLTQGPDIARRRGQGFSLVLGRNAFPALALDADQRSRLAEVLAGDVPTVLARQWNDALDDLG